MKSCLLAVTATLVAVVQLHGKPQVSRTEAYAVLSPIPVVEGELPEKANPEGLDGRVVTGYQGWFRAEGDGTGMGFHHYQKGGKFEPGHSTIDLWPDLSEFDEEEKFPTAFRHGDGSVAHVFSSLHPKTVDRHFRWMADYGIDGPFVQRFASHGAKERRSYLSLKNENEKLKLCRDAANRHGRCWVLMYDLSGISDDDFERLTEDWKQLRRKMQLGTDPADKAYLRVNGKPLVAVWGVGFNDDRDYTLKRTEKFLRLLKNNPDWGGMSLMLGVPYHWREQTGDATRDPELHRLLKLADVLSPWAVGRYRDMEKSSVKVVQHQADDLAWCERQGIHYLPVLFPGFSWVNLKGVEAAGEGIPRRGGEFYWQQFLATAAAGNRSAYLAMFDEVDEATALFKCTNDPPVGASPFIDYEGLPSDHYLWLSGEGGRLLRGELPRREE